MLKYTTSAVKDTFDFIRQAMYIFDITFQLFYIFYLGFRIFNNTGYLSINIILLVITFGYFLYFLISNQEFYTKDQKQKRSLIRYITKGVKRAVNLTVIGLAIYRLSLQGSINEVDNITMLFTILMILGFLFTLVFDVTLFLIDRRTQLIEASFYYDAELFRDKHTLLTKLLRMNKVDLEEILPTVTDPKMVDKIKETNHRQENKRLRHIDFKARFKRHKK